MPKPKKDRYSIDATVDLKLIQEVMEESSDEKVAVLASPSLNYPATKYEAAVNSAAIAVAKSRGIKLTM